MLTIRTVNDLKAGDHLCQIYETEEEHRQFLTPYLIYGLKNNEKVIYIVDIHTAEVILGYLSSEGFDPAPYIDSGQFLIISREETYLKEGSFNPERMINLLRFEAEKALHQGYRALRVTGEMAWALRGLSGSEKLIEYEAKLNAFFPGSNALAICQYNKKQFSPETLLNILKTHPMAVIGTEICNNFFYMPPEDFFDPDEPAVTLRQWIWHLLEHKKTEQQLVFLSKFPSENPNPVLRITKEGAIIYKNKAMDDLLIKLNFPSEDIFKILPEDVISKINSALETGKTFYDLEAAAADKIYAYTLAPIKESGYANLYGLDITERKKAEEAIQETLKIKADFTSMVSHELRTPLTALKESISLVLEGIVGTINEKQKKILEISKSNIDRLSRIINQVLDFQKAEAGKMEFKIEKNDINNVIKEIKESMLASARNKGLDLIIDLDDKLPEVEFDRDKIIQVLENLVNNSIKFTEKGGITIITRFIGNMAQVLVKDTGCGIKQEDIPKLFKQYEQLGRKFGGTGLGLVISKEIISGHGGKIWAESRFGEGASFYFVLPLRASSYG